MASRNLLLNSDFTRGTTNWFNWNGSHPISVVDNTEATGFTKALQVSINGVNQGGTQTLTNVPAGTYTFSGWAKSTVAGKDYLQVSVNTASGATYPKTSSVGTTMTRYSVTFTTTEVATIGVQVGRGGGDATATTFTGTGFQLETGSTTTAWVAGTEANMFQNTGFLNGWNNWSFNNPTGANLVKDIFDEVAAPSTKAVHIKSDVQYGGIWQGTADANATVGKTYTISLIAKGTANIFFGWEGLATTKTLTGQYQQVAYTFTYSSSRNYVFYTNGPGEIWMHSIKMEEGPYATDWVPSQKDINIGKDRPVLAVGQRTIIDYNDKVSLVTNISANIALSQQYSPADEKFIPDWTQTNMVLTASLYKGDSTTDIISTSDVTSIKWYKLSVLDNSVPVQLSNDSSYSIVGNRLTITQNVLNDKDSLDVICEVTYREPITTQTLISKKVITLTRVRNAGPLTKAVAWLPSGNKLHNGTAQGYLDNSDFGINVLKGTQDWAGWGYQNTGNVSLDTNYYKGTKIQKQIKDWAYYYTPSSSITLTSGGTYTASVWLKADVANGINPFVTVGKQSTDQQAILRSLVSEDGDTKVTLGWKRWKVTFTYNSSGIEIANNIRVEANGFPTDGSTNTLYVAGFKLEKGSQATDWSMNPSEIPKLDESLGANRWVFKRWNVSWATSYPTYDMVKSLICNEGRLVTDTSDLLPVTSGVGNYIGYLGTSVYVDNTIVWPINFKYQDSVTLYVNNQVAYQGSYTGTNTTATVTLSPGWNTIEFFYRAGGENIAPNSAFETWTSGMPNSWYKAADVTITQVTGSSGSGSAVRFTATSAGNQSNDRFTSPSGMLKQNTKYIVSLMARRVSGTGNLGMAIDMTGQYSNFFVPTSTNWTPVSFAFTTSYNSSSTMNFWPTVANDVFEIDNIKIEEGTVATPWSPAPADNGGYVGIYDIRIGENNLVLNSTFKNNWTSWVGVNGNYRILPPESDKPTSNIATVSASGNTSNPIYSAYTNRFAATTGDTFTFTVDFKVTDAAAWDSQYPFIVEFYNASGARVQYRDIQVSSSLNMSTVESGKWYRVSYTATVGGAMMTNATGVSDMVATQAGMRLTLFRNGEIFFREVKIEKKNTASPWTPALADNPAIDPHIVSQVGKQVNAFYTPDFEVYVNTLLAKCQLQRGSVIDTTNVVYQWYKNDPSVTTDQGGGVGWLKLGSSSQETGYNSDTLSIPPALVTTVSYYKCIIRDTQVDSTTYNGYFSSIVAITNYTLPIDVRVETNGTILLNGQGTKTLVAKLFQSGVEIDLNGNEYTYKWYRYLSDGTKDTTWAGGIGFKTGKSLTIGDSDVSLKATFGIEVE